MGTIAVSSIAILTTSMEIMIFFFFQLSSIEAKQWKPKCGFVILFLDLFYSYTDL